MVDGHSFCFFIVLPSEAKEEFLLVLTIIICRSLSWFFSGVLILISFYLLCLTSIVHGLLVYSTILLMLDCVWQFLFDILYVQNLKNQEPKKSFSASPYLIRIRW